MTDLGILTRDAFAPQFVDEVALEIPVFAMFFDKTRVTWKGGKTINKPVITTTAESLMEWYDPEVDPVTVTSKSYLAQPSFKWKFARMPIRISALEEVENVDASDENKIQDLLEMLLEQANAGARSGFDAQFHNATSAGDSGKKFQSIPEACGHSRTYGGLTSHATSAMKYWNGASKAGNNTDIASSMALTLENLRLCFAACRRYTKKKSRLFVFLGEALYIKLQTLFDATRTVVVKNGENTLYKYGFTTMELDGNTEFVMDSWMTDNSMTTHMMVVNPDTWELRMHPKRSFQVTKFIQQDEHTGGKDEKVALLKVCGNAVCWQPNGNMYKSNVA
jgi:hypothetical protein